MARLDQRSSSAMYLGVCMILAVSLRSNGFRIGARLDHFDRHRLERSWHDPIEYEEAADDFLTRPLTPQILECRRRNGALVRFHRVTCEFGILSADHYIVTYFLRTHDGLEYFRRECNR
jgi:hypothetical protein